MYVAAVRAIAARDTMPLPTLVTADGLMHRFRDTAFGINRINALLDGKSLRVICCSEA